jgi:F-type H+-transporting ATPase subunit b
MFPRSTFSGLGIRATIPGLILAGFLGWTALAGLVPRLNAQESQPAQPASGGAETQSQEAGPGPIERAEDPTEALRHSKAVRSIARFTHLSIDQAFWLCMGLNFAVVFFALWIPLRKKLPVLFRKRTDSIQQHIEEARKTSEEARRRLTEVEGRLSRLDVEITEMRREADENARAEGQRIAQETEEERRRIVASAEQEIALAAAAARRELKSYAAGLAVEMAEKKIKVGKDADQALVREFTARLGKDGN